MAKELKQKSYKARVEEGNAAADVARRYLDNRFDDVSLKTCPIVEDTQNGRDIEDENSDDDFSCKVRMSSKGKDVIHEGVQYWSEEKGTIKPPYNTLPGRDARGMSKYTICTPVSQDRILLPTTASVKEVFLQSLKEWGVEIEDREAFNGVVCPVVIKDDEFLRKQWFLEANREWNKYIDVFVGKNGVTIQFKIDEGKRKNQEPHPYGKLLGYIPPEVFVHCGCILLLPGEVLFKPKTWKPSTGERMRDYLL